LRDARWWYKIVLTLHNGVSLSLQVFKMWRMLIYEMLDQQDQIKSA
jgi:hypothetical protein